MIFGMEMATRFENLNVAEIQKEIASHEGTLVLRICDPPENGIFWFSPFSENELIVWWQSQQSFMFNPEGCWDPLYKFFNEPPPPHRDFDVPGLFVCTDHDHDEDVWQLWKKMFSTHKHATCELCCNSDSYLQLPDGRKFFHAGFKSE